MDTLITVVAERVRALSAALPPVAREARPALAPCPDQLSTPGVRLQGFMGELTGQPQSGWPFGAVGTDVAVGTGTGMGSHTTTRDHDHKTYNSIKFGNRQGPPCSPPV